MDSKPILQDLATKSQLVQWIIKSNDDPFHYIKTHVIFSSTEKSAFNVTKVRKRNLRQHQKNKKEWTHEK